jgi:nucleoid DNA-binding protein
MTKRELVTRIAGEMNLTQEQVYEIIQKTMDYMTEALVKGDTIEFRDFGVFEVKTRKSRIGRNPNKPENTVTIPPRRIVKFKPGKKMKELVGAAPVA